jgi:hypothetical protein
MIGLIDRALSWSGGETRSGRRDTLPRRCHTDPSHVRSQVDDSDSFRSRVNDPSYLRS